MKLPDTNFSMLSEFVSTYTRIYSQNVEKSASLSFKFNLLSLPYLKLGNSREYRYALSFFVRHHALCALFCSYERQSLLFSAHFSEK